MQVGPDGLAISLPEGTGRDAIAEINRLLVEGGISVYRLQHIQASLEDWFLSVTSRLGGPNDDNLQPRRASIGPAPTPVRAEAPSDHRGSWIPTWGMVTTRFMELRKRRGLMIALIAVNIGIPVVFLGVRLISHAVDPKSYGPAGGYSIFTTLVTGFMYVFGFIVAAVVGCTAGSVDLTEGMFRHLVITGRSRLALYLARIPAGLAIVIAMVAVGYTVVCVVCVLAAPAQLNYDGVNVPHGLSRPALDNWAAAHADEVICNFNYNGPNPPPNVSCGNGQTSGPPPGATINTPGGVVTVPTYTGAQIRAFAVTIANQDYADYSTNFLSPTDLPDGRCRPVDRTRSNYRVHRRPWTGFLDGTAHRPCDPPRYARADPDTHLQPPRDLAPGQRRAGHRRRGHGPHRPGGLPTPFGGGGGPGGGGFGRNLLIPESTLVASLVIVGWIVFWTAIGAWRMATRDA